GVRNGHRGEGLAGEGVHADRGDGVGAASVGEGRGNVERGAAAGVEGNGGVSSADRELEVTVRCGDSRAGHHHAGNDNQQDRGSTNAARKTAHVVETPDQNFEPEATVTVADAISLA